MGSIRVDDQSGKAQVLEAEAGWWRLMERIGSHGLSIEALGGGICASATCAAPNWAERWGPRCEDAVGLLLEAPLHATATSRLSCQIIGESDLDGPEPALVGDDA